MGALLVYSIIVGIVLIPLYFIVRLGMGNCTFHSFTRKVILSCYLIALLIPFLYDIDLSWSTSVADVSLELPAYDEIMPDYIVGAVSETPWWIMVAIMVYAAGLLFFIVRELVIVVRMCRLFKRCEVIDNGLRWKLLVHDCDSVAPFSWGNRIVISRKDYNDGAETIIAHESAHLERCHSLDLMLAECVSILAWYNPVTWLMHDELASVHEYETDEAVLRQGFDARDYQLLLIKKAVGSRFPSIANSLDHSNLSKRIKMMLRKRTSPGRRWIAAAAVPAIAMSAVLLSTQSVASALDEIADAKVTDFSIDRQTNRTNDGGGATEVDGAKPDFVISLDNSRIETDSSGNSHVYAESATVEKREPVNPQPVSESEDSDDKVYTQVEEMPRYPGGEGELMRFIGTSLRYPEKAKDDSIQGRVIVRFIVKKDGSIGETEILRSCHPLLDAEAVRVVKSIPKMIPGTINGKSVNVGYVLPIAFSLGGAPKARKFTDAELKEKVFTAVEKMPQYPGGPKELMEAVMKNLKYPSTDAQGRVILRFVVTSTGSIGDIEVVKSVSPELDQAAIDAVKPIHFEPGTINDKPVNVLYTLPISFKAKSVPADK